MKNEELNEITLWMPIRYIRTPSEENRLKCLKLHSPFFLFSHQNTFTKFPPWILVSLLLLINPRPPEVFFVTRPPKGVVSTPSLDFLNRTHKRRYRVCPIIHCCNSTTPYWITAPPILFYMVPCKEGHLCACNILGKHQPLVKRNISFESYEWALFIKVTLFTNGSGCPGTIVLWRCQKVMKTN